MYRDSYVKEISLKTYFYKTAEFLITLKHIFIN